MHGRACESGIAKISDPTELGLPSGEDSNEMVCVKIDLITSNLDEHAAEAKDFKCKLSDDVEKL